MPEIIKNEKQLNEAIEYLETLNTIALDTETNGLDPISNEVLLIQMGNLYKQFVFDVHLLGKKIYKLFGVLENPSIEIVIHNAKFDYKFLKQDFGITTRNMVCTMLAEKLLNQGRPNIPASLEALADKYQKVKLDKGLQKSFIGLPLGSKFSKEQYEYAGNDIYLLIPIWNKLKNYLAQVDMVDLARLEFRTVGATGDMELNGVTINKVKWLKLANSAQEAADVAKEKLDSFFTHIESDLFGTKIINYNSPEQLKKHLAIVLGKFIPNTNAQTLKKISHPVIEALTEYRSATKRVTTYGRKFLEDHLDADGKIRCQFNQLRAVTGRYSSSGPNLQNIPAESKYREPFEATNKNYRIISADFSGQELRLLAYLSKEPKFLEALATGKDLHSYSASLLYKIPYEKFVDENGKVLDTMKDKRAAAKTITFGLIYGMGVGRLGLALGVSFEEAKKLMKLYFNTFPAIEKLMEKLTKDVKKNKYAYSPIDQRRIDLTNLDWRHEGYQAHAINQAKNLPFQGGGASTTKLALCLIKEAIDLNEWDAKLIITVHDEILVEAHKDIAEEIAKCMKDSMIKAFNSYAPSIPMEVTPVISNHWVH